MGTAARVFFAIVALTAATAAQSGRPVETSRNPPLEEALARLKAGRAYGSATTGRITMATSERGQTLDNVLEVPADYDPSRRWPLRVSLHGGVGRRPPPQGGEQPRPLSNRTPLDGELVLHPRAWESTEWWTNAGADNIARLVERVAIVPESLATLNEWPSATRIGRCSTRRRCGCGCRRSESNDSHTLTTHRGAEAPRS